MERVAAVLLDLDGTLLESNEAHAAAFAEAAARSALRSPPVSEIQRLIGMGGDKLIPKAFGVEQESEIGRKLEERKGEVFRERYGPVLRPTPGARSLLERFKAEGLRLIVATSAAKDDLALLLEKAHIQDLVDGCTSASDVDESKPAPDIVQAALELAGVAAVRSVMLGDTPYDVEAARRAGVCIVAVRCGGWGDQDLEGAIAIYQDPAALLEAYDRSVFGWGAGNEARPG